MEKEEFSGDARLTMYVGEMHGGSGYTEMEFNPFEYAIIFREGGNKENNEIWLDVESMDEMVLELTDFVKKLNAIGVKTNGKSAPIIKSNR